VGGLVLEDNHVHHNYIYGFDPHSGSHDMIIRNNTVHDHGVMGVICSQDCYNITIEDNEVYKSAGSGIMFNRNMSDSVARNNYVHNEDNAFFYLNLYNNTITSSKTGLGIRGAGSENKISVS
jgi:parallel beta-helix repeat protein